MSNPLYSAFAKLRRAQEHIQLYQAEEGLLLDSAAHPEGQPFSLTGEFDSQTTSYVFKIERIPEVPVRWGLIAGDAIHNLRGALDHLAWALVCLGDNPEPKRPKLVQFPLSNSPEAFKARINERLPGVDEPKRALAERYQPYNGGDDDPLRLLRDLSNEDKHRSLNLVLLRARDLQVEFPVQAGCVVERHTLVDPLQPLGVGTELVRAHVRLTGGPKDVEIQGKLTTEPSFQHGEKVDACLFRIAYRVQEVLHEFVRLLSA